MYGFVVLFNTFFIGAGGLRFKSRAGQIGHSVANGSPALSHLFERSRVTRNRNDVRGDLPPPTCYSLRRNVASRMKTMVLNLLSAYFVQTNTPCTPFAKISLLGLTSDKENEGNFDWVNGHRAQNDDVNLWQSMSQTVEQTMTVLAHIRNSQLKDCLLWDRL